MRNGTVLLGLSAAGLCLAAVVAVAQPRPLTDLSFTAEQLANGHAEYTQSCVDCHGANLNDGEFGGAPLKGAAFRAKWFGRPVGALVAYAHAAMPPGAPGRLPLDTYVEIIAYILSVNGIAPGAQALPVTMPALNQLRIPTNPSTDH